jgi:predicted HNH restriction endonuclease
MIYIFQRIIQNHFQWTRPSPGRLGSSGEGAYVQKNGFGHEDWNFNKNLLIDGYIYGYCYYQPIEAKRDENFNIIFATYTNKQWHLVGFYLNCQFIIEPPISSNVVQQKIRDLQQLSTSLGSSFRTLEKQQFVEVMKKDSKYLRWRVKPEDAVRTNQPIIIPKTIFDTKNFRIVKPTTISKEIFNVLYSLAEQENNFDYSDDAEFPEGKELEIKHITRERNQALIKKAEEKFKNTHGHLFCEICGFNFNKKYGAIGHDFIEAHHTVPICELKGEVKTNINDIALVCSNCHRMLHRKRPWLEMKHLKNLIAEKA